MEMADSPPRRLRPHLDPEAHDQALIYPGTVDELSTATVQQQTGQAMERPPEEGARPEDVDVIRRVATAPVVRMGRIPYASNAVFLLELEGPDPDLPEEPLRAVYKPDRGERPLWDFPRHTLHLREVGSYLVNAALGLAHIPPTVLREGPLGPGSCQLFKHNLRHSPGGPARASIDAQLRSIAVLDALINNADRKRAHLLVGPPHHVYGIDNALTFLPYPRQRTILVGLSGSPLSKKLARTVAGLAADQQRRTALRRRLSLLLAPIEVEAFEHRLDELAADPVYPLLDPWDGRPFEWF